MAQLTPMLKQYKEIKDKHEDAILFFRLGDFYEMFGPDAIDASKILNITLTARNKGTDNEMPMCGVPYHAAEGYIAKLTKAGNKVAICEQVSDPNGEGIVDREVIRIVTPGTTLDTSVIQGNENNYLVSLCKSEIWGMAFVDLTTGEFKLSQLQNFEEVLNELNRLDPAEILITPSISEEFQIKARLENIANTNTFRSSALETAEQALTKHFNTKNLQGFGIDKCTQGIEAAGNLLMYLNETQKTSLEHINTISLYNPGDYMILDEATVRNLELIYTYQSGDQKGSLLDVMDKTVTGMGGRLLRNWILHPLIDVTVIKDRHDVVDEFCSNPEVRETLTGLLKELSDIERLIGRLGCSRANARDLINLQTSLEKIPAIKEQLAQINASYSKDLASLIQEHSDIKNIIEKSIDPDPPLTITEGGIIKDGYDKELDELRKISTSGKDWIKELQETESSKTGISSLKVKFNKVFGYYIEVSKANMSQVPESYIRKQTLVNAERFITPELKEYEEKVLGAEDKIKVLEQKLFFEIRDQVSEHFEAIQNTAHCLAQIDVLLNFANVALLNNYHKPQITEQGPLAIKNGRHPVIENINQDEAYVPNDSTLNHDDHQLILLTGPNMSGKSSYLRQNALIVLLAQIGSFVPADDAEIGIVDRIFTRVGASDNLAAGQSTFMVEMQEAANILHNATQNSLIILDELGRGTSTYDGVSIAWAITEHIHESIQAKTLFATHYHELVEIVEKLPKAKNYCVAVKETDTGVVFLRKVIEGAINRSYGIEVAKLAGFPSEITDRANQILDKLESELTINGGQQSIPLQKSTTPDPIKQAIKDIDIDNITPLQALNILKDLKQK